MVRKGSAERRNESQMILAEPELIHQTHPWCEVNKNLSWLMFNAHTEPLCQSQGFTVNTVKETPTKRLS